MWLECRLMVVMNHEFPCLQDRVRELESEIEWVRAERQDAQQAAQREQKQAQARIKEAEDAASRAKAARRSAPTHLPQLTLACPAKEDPSHLGFLVACWLQQNQLSGLIVSDQYAPQLHLKLLAGIAQFA